MLFHGQNLRYYLKKRIITSISRFEKKNQDDLPDLEKEIIDGIFKSFGKILKSSKKTQKLDIDYLA